MSTYKIIQSLSATRSRIEKEEILRAQVDNIQLKTFFKLALDPFINFFQKKEPISVLVTFFNHI